MSRKSFYITTPIYYPSDKLHIGHAYTTVAADAIARFKRIEGYDVMFLTGTDEHGQKIERKAREKGIEPQEYVDEIVQWIKGLWKRLYISHDDFIRTTQKRHEQTVQEIFKRIYEKGDIYKSTYEGWYCTPCETFWLERQLEEGRRCPDCGRETEWMEEESYFFKMSKYTDRWLEYIEEHPEFIQPASRRNEMINFVKSGLEDLCISRTSIDWGIPLPIDEDHVIYVWFDALSNYLTGIKYLRDRETFERYWPADLHLVGKEIMRFHTIIWPIMLMALDLPLPKKVFGHGWLILESGKMSKSKGNVVDPIELIEDFGVDPIRYYLLREIAFGQDGVYSTEALIQRTNADLANDLGNLLHRTISMVEKYFGGVIPEPAVKDNVDRDLKHTGDITFAGLKKCMDSLEISVALEGLWNFIRRTNKYIDQTEPWVLARKEEDRPRLQTVIYNLCDSLRKVAIALKPFLPETPPEIWRQLGLQEPLDKKTWDDALAWGQMPAGTKVNKGEPLFPRIDLEEYLEKKADSKSRGGKEKDVKKEEKNKVKKEKKKKKEKEEEKPEITFEEFQKLEFRIAEIVAAERIEGADKLLKLKVNLGNEERQVVAGIAKHYRPGELIGKKIITITNLKPVTIFGIKSEAMLLAASDDSGRLVLSTVDEDIAAGARVK